MAQTPFRVELSPTAEADLYEIIEYWSARSEPWRGEKYFRDLTDLAARELSNPTTARRGRSLKSRSHSEAREILAFGIYRIIYEIDEAAGRVDILRFWHTHRHDPHGEL